MTAIRPLATNCVACLAVAILAVVPGTAAARAQSGLTAAAPAPIRGAHHPALSPDGSTVCFTYRGDLWTAPTTGGAATRLTVHRAYDSFARWSPDGRWIAFSSNREGAFDVFVMPSRGGEARQVTYHGADDIVSDWSPDGRAILFTSARDGRFADLHLIDVSDGRLRRLTRDRTSSRHGAFLPDGKSVVYTRGGQAWWRPRYLGSQSTDIYTMEIGSGTHRRLTSVDGWDGWPMPSADGRHVYFVSARGGSTNLWRTDVQSGAATQVTRHPRDHVFFPSMSRDGSRVVYERDFRLWSIDLRSHAPPQPIDIVAQSDRADNPAERVEVQSGASGLSVSPDGKALAFSARGEIWSVKSEGGDAKRVTRNPSAEEDADWAPDGKTLAYTSDRAGNVDVFVADATTGAETAVTTDPADDVGPTYSPDGRLLAFTRTGGPAPGLYVAPVPAAPGAGWQPVLVAPGVAISSPVWSPDSRWIAFARRDVTATTDVWVVPAVGGTAVNVTQFPGFNGVPQWTRDGSYLLFISTRDTPVGTSTPALYALRLVPRPPDEEPPASARAAPPGDADPDELGASHDHDAQRRPPQGPPGAQAGPGAPATPALGGPVVPRATDVRIDFERIEHRARPLLATREAIGAWAPALDGRTVIVSTAQAGQSGWFAVDIASGALQRLSMGDTGSQPQMAPDGSGFFHLAADGTVRRLVRGQPAPAQVAFSARLEIIRAEERRQTFNQAWRLLRTRFYDPDMHGIDWEAVRARYEPLVDDASTREEFGRLLTQMIGELNASHMGATPPQSPGPRVATGYLGLTFDSSFAGPGLRIAEVMPGGPCDQPGRKLAPGEYVAAIDGRPLAYVEDLYKELRDKEGRDVELTVTPAAPPAPTDGKVGDAPGLRTVRVRAVSRAAIGDLEYERGVMEARRKVEELSGGAVGYVHIRSMDQPSLRRFERELFGAQQSKRALVIDVRFNGGGRIHDELLALLVRRPHVTERPRDGELATQPFQVWNRPAVVMINEFSASDAEIFPNGFRENGLGKLVGVPTYGGVIGTFNVTLVDGTRFRVPTTGWFTLAGQNMENNGVRPDIHVENSPEDNAAGRDRQLEAAVQHLMGQIGSR
ncbi:MAG TPA: S41 family peptidase [Chthonomonadales bacterium]|nr:S41 family peptidase [Chthonomonadales bacterium]